MIQLTGLDTLKDSLSKYTDRVTKQVKDIVAQSAQDIAEAAKANAPAEMKDSIQTEISDDGLSASITATHPDAATTEYGEQGKPSLNPAFEENRQKVIDNIANTLQG